MENQPEQGKSYIANSAGQLILLRTLSKEEHARLHRTKSIEYPSEAIKHLGWWDFQLWITVQDPKDMLVWSCLPQWKSISARAMQKNLFQRIYDWGWRRWYGMGF